MTELENLIYEIVRKIPKGKVATYKQIAIQAGNPKLARFVGNTMHKNPVPYYSLAYQQGYDCEYNIQAENSVPCHRVVNSEGKLGSNFGLGGPNIQKKMLEAEGIQVTNNIVDLVKYQHIF